MPAITHDILSTLASHERDLSISMYLPTHRHGPEIEGDKILLKNLIAKAAEELMALGLRRPDSEKLLEPPERLLRHASFWQHQNDGLALFTSDGDLLDVRLPNTVEPLVVIANRYHITPLLPALGPGRFLPLALSRGSVRLFEATRTGIAPLEIDAPASIDDSSWFADREAQLQHHATASGSGRGPAAFHGHDPSEQEAEDLRRFLQAVAQAVAPIAREAEAPVVLAAVDEIAAAYRKLAPHSVEDRHISGNPDELPPHEIHRRSLDLMLSHLEQTDAAAHDRVATAIERGDGTADLEEALRAAAAGRVEEIVIAEATHRWGVWDPESQRAEVRSEREPGDEDLCSRAAALTVTYGGDAWLVESVPGDDAIAARFRF